MKRDKILIGGAAVIGALLLWAAFAPMNETCAILFAVAPMLMVSRRCSPKRSAWAWFACGMLFWFATLSWMPAIVKNNGPWPLVLLGWLGLAALCSGHFALFGWLSARCWRQLAKDDGGVRASPWLRLLALGFIEPVLWAGTEWLRSVSMTGFAWNYLGTALGSIPTFTVPARLGGVYLVSALVLLLNGVFATLGCRLLAQMRRENPLAGMAPKSARLLNALETGLPLGLIILSFWVAQQTCPQSQAVVPLKVALVQRNAPCIFSRRDRAENPYDVFDRLLAASTAAKPDLVVWGESSMAEFGVSLGDERAKTVARHFAETTGGAALLAGGDWWYTENNQRKAWNAAALYTVASNQMVDVQVYGKQHLVPFGEYIYLDKWITPLQKLSPIGISLWPGEAKVLKLFLGRGAGEAEGSAAGGALGRGAGAPEPPSVLLSPLICFEDTDPTLSRKAAKLGAQAIVLITNDSWFSHSTEAEQHAAQAVLRAVETGLPVIRVGNSGVTGIITPGGRTRWLEDGEGRTLVDSAGTMLETVHLPQDPRLTPYTKAGDWPLWALSIIALFFTLAPFPFRVFVVQYPHEKQ